MLHPTLHLRQPTKCRFARGGRVGRARRPECGPRRACTACRTCRCWPDQTVPKLQSPRRGPQVLLACLLWRIVLLLLRRAQRTTRSPGTRRARPRSRRRRESAQHRSDAAEHAPVCDGRRRIDDLVATVGLLGETRSSGLANKCQAVCNLWVMGSRAKTGTHSAHTITRWEEGCARSRRFRRASRLTAWKSGMKAKRRVLVRIPGDGGAVQRREGKPCTRWCTSRSARTRSRR